MKFETLPFPTSIFRFLSFYPSIFTVLFTSLSASTSQPYLFPFPRPFHAVVNVSLSLLPLSLAFVFLLPRARLSLPPSRPLTPIYLPVMDIIK